jgi:hypothetical protein
MLLFDVAAEMMAVAAPRGERPAADEHGRVDQSAIRTLRA